MMMKMTARRAAGRRAEMALLIAEARPPAAGHRRISAVVSGATMIEMPMPNNVAGRCRQ
jgi:hypothetical protein